MAADFLDVCVLLQVGARNVQGYVRGVNHTVQEREEIGNDVLHVIRDEHLVGIQVDFVPTQFHFLLELREIQNAREVEGEVDIQVNVKQRILEVHRVQVLVELGVILVLQVGWGLAPQGGGGVDHARDRGFNLLDVAVFVFLT